MNLYLDNGYLDMKSIIESEYPFIFVPAARGTGKTYGALKYHLEHDHKILFIRRTKQEAELQEQLRKQRVIQARQKGKPKTSVPEPEPVQPLNA